MSASLSHTPVYSTKPLIFNYRETVELYAGAYEWSLSTRDYFTPKLDIDSPNLYIIKSFSFAADINELDYQSAMDIQADGVPEFSLYLRSEGSGTILRMPLQLPVYYRDQEFVQSILPKMGQSGAGKTTGAAIEGAFTAKQANQFMGSFKGKINHTPALVGKQNITLTMTFYIQEIKDQKFIQTFKEPFGGNEKPTIAQRITPQTLRRY